MKFFFATALIAASSQAISLMGKNLPIWASCNTNPQCASGLCGSYAKPTQKNKGLEKKNYYCLEGEGLSGRIENMGVEILDTNYLGYYDCDDQIRPAPEDDKYNIWHVDYITEGEIEKKQKIKKEKKEKKEKKAKANNGLHIGTTEGVDNNSELKGNDNTENGKTTVNTADTRNLAQVGNVCHYEE